MSISIQTVTLSELVAHVGNAIWRGLQGDSHPQCKLKPLEDVVFLPTVDAIDVERTNDVIKAHAETIKAYYSLNSTSREELTKLKNDNHVLKEALKTAHKELKDVREKCGNDIERACNYLSDVEGYIEDAKCELPDEELISDLGQLMIDMGFAQG